MVDRERWSVSEIPVTDHTAPAPAAYQPTSRRPIAGGFRKTAALAVRLCLRWNIHPDMISCLSMVAAAGAGLCFWFSSRNAWLLIVAPLLCYVRLWMNMLDGMVALAAGKASWRGEILNDLPDRVSDVLIFVGVAHSGWCRRRRWLCRRRSWPCSPHMSECSARPSAQHANLGASCQSRGEWLHCTSGHG